MEVELGSSNHLPGVLHRLLPALGPVLLISLTYIDPGKWAATVEGGARFGYDLALPMLIFNFAAILCQYLSACIGVITGKDLAQICSDEYDKFTCMFLGVQATVSMIVLDLTMILGIAHGLNLLFGVDLSTGVFLTALDAVLSPLFSNFLERWKENFLFVHITGLILLLYILGVLISQPEISLSMNGMLTKLSEDSVLALMSILGANIMPHNFYLHSSIVLQHHGPSDVSKSALCHNHFWVIFCIFSGIYLVNYVLMNSAANVFNSNGLMLVTFPDALSLMEQAFRSPMAPLTFLLILYLTSQLTSLTWSLGGQAVLHEFLRLDIPNWLQRATIRIIAIIPALYCIWTGGVEGVYQLLIFTQVMVALLLPSSVIPLLRVATSRQIMSVYKISQLLEFLVLITFMGMLGLNIIFVVEMIFGDSDWVGNLRWNMGGSTSIPYLVLLITACSSFCLMLWLAAAPLKSATQLDAQARNWDMQNAIPEPSEYKEEMFLGETRYPGEGLVQKEEKFSAVRKSIESYTDFNATDADLGLPETIMESEQELHLTTIEENHSDSTFPSSAVSYQEDSASMTETVSVSAAVKEVADGDYLDAKKIKSEPIDIIENPLVVEGDLQTEKQGEVDAWKPEDLSKAFSGNALSLTSDGPGSLGSLNGKSDEGGNGAGSLSRLAGLGRAARRQFAATLEEFWGQLYDQYGQATPDARAQKLDVLLGDSKLASFLLKVDTSEKEFSGYFRPLGGRGLDSWVNSGLCNSSMKPRVQNNMDSSYGVQSRSSLWSNHTQLLDAYVRGPSHNVVDSAERRYSSMRTLPSSNDWDNQPATVHDYQIASVVNQIAKDRSSNSLGGQLESPASMSPSMGTGNYKDPYTFDLTQKLQNGLSSSKASGFQNFRASRNSPLKSESPYYDVCTSGFADNGSMSANTKNYHSSPDISGLSGPYRDLYMSEKSTQGDTSVGFGSSVGRSSYQQLLYSNIGSGGGVSALDDLSRGYGDALSYNVTAKNGSLWSKQPFEQFGVADKNHAVGSPVGGRSNSIIREGISMVDSEAQLLQFFRHCIVKLLKLEGSDWLFMQNDGADEDLIDRVAGREQFLYEAEMRDFNLVVALKNGEAGMTNISVSSVPHCGEECVWKVDLIVSFGVWCIHRILDLSILESRPELWGKYTYALNHLQVYFFNSLFHEVFNCMK
uniref:Ethylene insensitive protein n=1 Tax=Rhizophora mucronata TaxID=61149 RepID=A0A2P2MC83_RHIMU